MIEPAVFLQRILRPGLAWLEGLGGPQRSDAAATLLLAIALQESNLTHRYQVIAGGGPGPARSWWQFEQGGVSGVLRHPASRGAALAACADAWVEPLTLPVWRAIEGHDGLACAMARLLLYTDPKALPTNEEEAWSCYAHRLWRPGKPHRERWSMSWPRAVKTVKAPLE